MLWEMRRGLLPLVALLVCAIAGSALAATGDREQHRFTAADQAAARSAVLVRSDLGKTGWTGGAKKPDLSPPVPCANWNPKQSDLVLTGAAETDWKHAGLEIDTEAQVLQTAEMVKLDWQRTVTDPHAIPCLESELKKSLSGAASAKFVSFKRLSFPHIGTFSRAYLTTIDVTSSGKTVPVVIEVVLVGSKRTELTMTSTTAKALQSVVAPENIRLARKLVARAKA
jgi:hypothetical protein